MPKAKLLLTSFLASTFIYGCGGGSGSGGNNKSLDHDNTPPSSKAMGTFSEVGDQSNVDQWPENCPSNTRSIDSRLKVGRSFRIEDKWLATSGDYIGQVETKTILSIDRSAGKVSSRREFALPNGEGVWVKETCTSDFDNSSTKCDANEISENLKQYMDQGDGSWSMSSCFVKWNVNRQGERKVTFGEYKFANGKTVSAYRIEESATGTVECWNNESGDPISEGNGKESQVKIISADVPEIRQSTSCGGPSTVFEYQKTELDSGKIMSHKKFEIQSGSF